MLLSLDCCQKSLILDPSHCLIQFSIVQDSIVPIFNRFYTRHVCKICYIEYILLHPT